LPRLGSRRTVLLTQCLIAPFAALTEWLWLGTRLNLAEIFCVAVILTGVVVALAPGDHLKIAPRRLWIGILASTIAALGGAFGAVLSRKAYFVAHAAGEHPDPGTTGYQRVVGGAVALGLVFLIVKWRHARRHGDDAQMMDSFSAREKLKLWPWVLVNSVAGQTIGVSCMQWALENTPTGIVTAIIAMTPIVMLPLARIFEGEKITARSLTGGLIAVAGVLGLTFWH
jgi:drug/metabolite transporter (DMT)-like permease